MSPFVCRWHTKVPGPRPVTLRCSSLGENLAPYYLIAFDSAKAPQAGTASSQGPAVTDDLANFATAGPPCSSSMADPYWPPQPDG